MRSFLDIFFRLCAAGGALFLLLIGALILAQALGRLVGITVPDANELAGFSVAAGGFLALGPTLRHGGHIRVTLLTARLAARWRRAVELAALTVSIALASYFTYWVADMAIEAVRFNDVSPGVLAFPLWIPQAGMAVGLAGLLLALIEALVLRVRGRPVPYDGFEAGLTE